jgi:hypothetical protein
MRRKRLRTAALVGALAELTLALPLIATWPFLGPGPFPAWMSVLSEFQEPGASVVVRLLRAEWIRQVAERFKVAHGIFLFAQGLVMITQALLFALTALGVMYGSRLGHRRQQPPAGASIERSGGS